MMCIPELDAYFSRTSMRRIQMTAASDFERFKYIYVLVQGKCLKLPDLHSTADYIF